MRSAATDKAPAWKKCLRFNQGLFNSLVLTHHAVSPLQRTVQVRITVSSGILYHTATLITTASCFANDARNCSGIETMTMPSYAV